MRDWLADRLHGHLDVDAALAAGRFVTEDGTPLRPDARYRPHTFVWFHRELPAETPVAGEIRVVYRDDRIVVVDKPPFLSSIPRGRHIRESVVVRMRAELGLSELTPMHRLDRVTSGLLLLATERRWRGAYQSMFMRGEVQKRYRAIAPLREDLRLPVTVRNHLSKQRGVWQAEVLPGREPNAESVVELAAELSRGVEPPGYPASAETASGFRFETGSGSASDAAGARFAEYRLTPRTGKTHQLRMHMWGLGIPIVGDPLYPEVRSVALDDFRAPLQLLASELSFRDPVDGAQHCFVSERKLPLVGVEAMSA